MSGYREFRHIMRGQRMWVGETQNSHISVRRQGSAGAFFLWVCCIALAVIVGGVSETWALPEDSDLETMDRLFARVALVRKEIELLRREMGRPTSVRPGIRVTDATAREVFSAARNLFDKANRLSFEQTRELAPSLEAPVGEILPFDVSVVVTAALVQLREVKSKLQISESSAEPPIFGTKTSGDILVSIIEASRQLDLLLDQGATSSDTFQQVTLSVGYAARLLARFPGQSRIPEAPPFERHKIPGDVYRRLLKCFEHVRLTALSSNIKVLQLHVDEQGLGWVTPADTHELALLLVAELAYLHKKLPSSKPPRNVYYPGRKFPSHVCQRAGILETQLRNLERRVERNPLWLERVILD